MLGLPTVLIPLSFILLRSLGKAPASPQKGLVPPGLTHMLVSCAIPSLAAGPGPLLLPYLMAGPGGIGEPGGR